MRTPRTASLFSKIVIGLALFGAAQFCLTQSNTATTRTNNPDGSTTVTTTTTYRDGSTTTSTNYDKEGHDAGTTRTDVQTKDGETTTTITKYDGNGHELGKTVKRLDKDGNATVTTYDGNGHETGKTATLVGIVLPRDARPGDQISGSVVPNPKDFESIPALQVIEVPVPQNAGVGGQVQLQGMVVDMGDGRPQRADQPLTVKIAKAAEKLPISISGGETGAWHKDVPLARSGGFVETVVRGGESFSTLPVCIPGTLHAVHGPLSGDATKTMVRLGDTPATILAESPRTVYMKTPAIGKAGATTLTLEDGATKVTFPVVALQLQMAADRTKLKKGESTRFRVTVAGPEALPTDEWSAGVPSELLDMTDLRSHTPGLREPAQGGDGEILLRVDNASPGVVAMSPPQVIKMLRRQDFARGPYVFEGTVHSEKTGDFTLNGLVVAFLGDVVAGGPGGGPVIAEDNKTQVKKKRGEWRAVGVDTTTYTSDTKDLAKTKEKLAEAAQKFLDKAAPSVGKLVKELPAAFSITNACNVYVTYACVDLDTGKVVKTKVVQLDDKDAINWWAKDKAGFNDPSRESERGKSIARNRPTDPCP